mgnify:CR=1 FL=1
MKKIGMIGCGGRIGPMVCGYLAESGYEIQGGQRREPDYSKYPSNFTWKHLDVNNDKELAQFCEGCDVVLNCAGPAYMLLEKVALAAAAAGAVYVDVSDALAFNDEVRSRIEGKGRFYLASGFYPGFTGLMLNKAIQSFDSVNNITGYSGGAELYSLIGCLDIIMSGTSPYCLNGYYLKDGKPVKNSMGMDYCEHELFEGKVFLKHFLSNEMYSVVKRYPPEKIKELHWYDVSSDNVIGLMAMKYYQLHDKVSFDEMYAQMGEYLQKIEKKTEEDEWAILYVFADGISGGEEKTVSIKIDLSSTSDITAYSAASAALAALERDDPNGVYWANQIFPDNIMDIYKKRCDEKGIPCGWLYEEEFAL